MEQRWQQISWWHWDADAAEWSDQHSENLYDDYINEFDTGRGSESVLHNLTLLSFNVMHDDWGREHIVQTDRRFRRTLDLLERANADFIGLNEVNKQFQQMLLKEDWVKKGYFVSDASEAAETLKSPSGNVLLSRVPFHSLYTIALTSCTRKAVVGIVDLCVSGEMRRTCVCAVHPLAFSWNIPKRRLQIGELQETIEKALPADFDDIIIMGDFNLHHPKEDALIPKGYSDIWPLVRSDPGYTFDAAKNKLLAETWPLAFESRRMRLDRIIFKSNPSQKGDDESSSSLWKPESIRLFAHLPVASPIEEDEDEGQEKEALQFERKRNRGWLLASFVYILGWLTFPPRFLKALIAFSCDLLGGINIFRKVDEYLWPSDHFGLLAVLTTSNPSGPKAS